MKEIWKDIKYYEGLYQVSNLGRVKSLDRWVNDRWGKRLIKGKILKPNKKTSGYLFVALWKDGKRKHFFIHRLVWEAFNGTIPEGMQVNHIKEDKTDNRLDSLNLMTPKENINWGTCIKRRAAKRSDAVLQLTLDKQLVKEWPSAKEAERNGFKHSNVSACCSGKRKIYKGFIWRKKCCTN